MSKRTLGHRGSRWSGLSLCLFLLAFYCGSAPAEKIRTVVPQSNLNYLSLYVAESKGFFEEQGLENETLVISGPLATTAILSGDVDYGGGGGSAMRAAMSGAPIKTIFFQTEKVTFYLVTHPSITTDSDLKGKKVGIGQIGSSQDRLILQYIERAGLAPSDITRLAMGADASRRILAIKTGSIDATLLDPGTVIFAERQGLNVSAFLGDLFPFPFQGFVTTDKKLRESPDQVKRWLRAMIKALMFVRDRSEEAADIGMKRLRIGNVSKGEILKGINHYKRALPVGVPGLPSSEGIKNFVEYEIRLPLKIEGNVPRDKLFNFKLLEEVISGIDSKGTVR